MPYTSYTSLKFLYTTKWSGTNTLKIRLCVQNIQDLNKPVQTMVPIIIFLHTRVTIKFYILKITIRRIMSISQVMRTLITRHLIFANTIILAHTPLLFMLFSAVLIEP